jgi:hypothetical protein
VSDQTTETVVAPSISETEAADMNAVASELAKSEDITKFAEEVRDQERWKSGDTAPDPIRIAERRERRAEAVRIAREETSQVLDGHEAPAPDAQNDAFDAEPMQQERSDEERIRRDARAELLIQQKEAQDPGWTQRIGDTFAVYPAMEHVIERVSVSPFTTEILERMADNPEEIDRLNGLSPQNLHTELSRLEGIIYAQNANASAAQQYEQNNQYARRQSKAPPPHRKISGGASPAKDLAGLAKSDKIDEFAKAFSMPSAM